MQPDRRQRQQNISGRDCFAVNDLVAIHHADDKAGDVVLAVLIEPRHLCGLATKQYATIFAATIRHAFDDTRNYIGRQLSRRDVIQKEKRPSALNQNVVHTMIDEIAADGVVYPSRKRDLEFGADAIGRSDEHRLRETGKCAVKHSTKASDFRKRALVKG